jgi:gas vesicle protein
MGTRADELKSDLERQRDALGEDLEAVGDRVSPSRVVERRRAALRQGFGRLRDRVMGTADSARGGMSDAAGTAGKKAGEATEAVKDRLSDAPQAVGSATAGNPLAAGLIAFGAGMLTASLVPPTQREHQAAEQLKPMLDDVKDEAKTVAQEAAERLRPQAEDAVAQVRDQAASAAETVKDEAASASEQVKSDASGAAEEIKGAAKRPSS